MATATEFHVRRAWSATCPDGHLRDRLANAVANRIGEENHDSAMQGYPPELVEDYLDRIDTLYADECTGDETPEQIESFAATVDTTDLYDLVGE